MNELDFKTAFKYPFNRPAGLFNILWILLPIIGLFAYIGYLVRIVNEYIEGKYKELPKFDFGNDLSLGFLMFLKAIPFSLALGIVIGILNFLPVVGWLANIAIIILIVPIVAMNFIRKQTVDSFFEFAKVTAVFQNFGDYLFVILKSIGLGIVFGLLSIVLVGIPAGSYTKHIFIADFYRRYAK